MFKKPLILISFAFIGWAFCGAIMGVGPQLMSMQTTLIVHLILGPAGFGVLSVIYQQRFGYASPLSMAVFFILFVIAMDYLLVGLIILQSLEMFESAIGTWIPFTLIFLVSWAAGFYARKSVHSV